MSRTIPHQSSVVFDQQRRGKYEAGNKVAQQKVQHVSPDPMYASVLWVLQSFHYLTPASNLADSGLHTQAWSEP